MQASTSLHLSAILASFLDNILSSQPHISSTCKITYPEQRRIRFIRNYLSMEATQILICFFVLSRLACCNSHRTPNNVTEKPQRIQNNAARLVFQSSRYDQILLFVIPYSGSRFLKESITKSPVSATLFSLALVHDISPTSHMSTSLLVSCVLLPMIGFSDF